MVHIAKVLIAASIVAAPAFAIPIEVDDATIQELLRRDPSFFSKIGGAIKGVVNKVAPVLSKVNNIAKKVAPIASMVPGPIGAAARVYSFLPREELEFYSRQINEELEARDYEEALMTRGLQLTDTLQARDDGDELAARALEEDELYERQFVDAEDLGTRENLESREP